MTNPAAIEVPVWCWLGVVFFGLVWVGQTVLREQYNPRLLARNPLWWVIERRLWGWWLVPFTVVDVIGVAIMLFLTGNCLVAILTR